MVQELNDKNKELKKQLQNKQDLNVDSSITRANDNYIPKEERRADSVAITLRAQHV